MPRTELPDELKKSHWDKKKGALEGATSMETVLKAIQKKHEAVAWDDLATGWHKPFKDAAALKAEYERLDKVYRLKVSPLRLEANELLSLADKAAKAKDAGKPLKEACLQIAKVAGVYAKSIAAGLDALESEFEAALKSLPEPTKDDADDESDSALIDPKRLLRQLQLCKADPARSVHFAFLDDGGEQAPELVLHHRLTGKGMLARLIKDTGVKKGAFGLLSLDGTDLKLVVEKKVSGLVKRIRIPIRACGFKIGKVALLNEAGESLDEDLEQGDDVSGTQVQSPDTSPSSRTVTTEQALDLWRKARESALASLKQAAKDIASLKDPESAKAIIELNAVIKNLTAEPRSKSQVAELIRYIDKDDVVLDVSEFSTDIRTPLLKVLTVLAKVAV